MRRSTSARLNCIWGSTLPKKQPLWKRQRQNARSGVEVDCVVYGAGRFEAIKVKNSNRVRPEDERGLRAFLSDYPEARATVVYRGERPLERSGIRWIPVETFLRSLGP